MPFSRGFGDRQRMKGVEGRREGRSGRAAPENRHDRKVGGRGERLPREQMAGPAEDAEGRLRHRRIDGHDVAVRDAPGELRSDASRGRGRSGARRREKSRRRPRARPRGTGTRRRKDPAAGRSGSSAGELRKAAGNPDPMRIRSGRPEARLRRPPERGEGTAPDGTWRPAGRGTPGQRSPRPRGGTIGLKSEIQPHGE